MDYAVPVGVVESTGDFMREPHRIIYRELPLALEPGAQRLAVYVRHHIEELSFHLPRIEQREDVRVLQGCRDVNLGEKTICAEDRRELWVNNFDGDLAAMPHILRQIHGGHSAPTELALDTVAVAESG